MGHRPQRISERFRLGFPDEKLTRPSDPAFRGEHHDVLDQAHCRLNDSIITPRIFNNALNDIHTFSKRLRVWAPLVEAAYARLPNCGRRSVLFSIMSFRSACDDYPGVLRLMPGRFTGPFALVNLAFVLEAAFALKNKFLVKQLAKLLPDAIEDAAHPEMREHLRFCLSEACKRYGV